MDAFVNPHLLHTRYDRLATNTIDYWMTPDEPMLTQKDLLGAMAQAPLLPGRKVQIYLHIPYCAQRCSFCAFSGGNTLDNKAAERYATLLVWQLNDLIKRLPVYGEKISSVNIGGGSPDLVQGHIAKVLRAVRDLPGVDQNTEISVEFALSTVKKEFIDALADYEITKASFGIQSMDPDLRGYLHQPRTMKHLPQVLEWINGRIPIVNADLITCLPGQSLQDVHADLQALIDHPQINAVSSYLLTPGAAPALVADLMSGRIPPQASRQVQAQMRLHTYTLLQKNGWVRRGTNTYCDAKKVPADILNRVAGNECIGTADYEDFLLAAGAQAISAMPGVRAENTVDINEWMLAAERGEHSFHLPKCSLMHQEDTALWVFPLRYEGLPKDKFERMRANGVLSDEQLASFAAFIDEGLIVDAGSSYQLSILGEVFMGHMVHDLKKPEAQRVIEDYIKEGYALGEALQSKKIKDGNYVNNRQLAEQLLSE